MYRGQHSMGRGFDIPLVKGSKYHVKEGQHTTVRGSIPYRKGVKISCIGSKNTMHRGVKIPWLSGLYIMGRR